MGRKSPWILLTFGSSSSPHTFGALVSLTERLVGFDGLAASFFADALPPLLFSLYVKRKKQVYMSMQMPTVKGTATSSCMTWSSDSVIDMMFFILASLKPPARYSRLLRMFPAGREREDSLERLRIVVPFREIVRAARRYLGSSSLSVFAFRLSRSSPFVLERVHRRCATRLVVSVRIRLRSCTQLSLSLSVVLFPSQRLDFYTSGNVTSQKENARGKKLE